MDHAEILIGITEIAVALAGFTGVVVVFGSRSAGSWHPGDQLRLGFLLEASLTAGGVALVCLILYISLDNPEASWAITSGVWMLVMGYSLLRSRRLISENLEHHDDIDKTANRLVGILFSLMILLQVSNIMLWQHFAPVLAALVLNLAGATMQFARLIRSAFHE